MSIPQIVGSTKTLEAWFPASVGDVPGSFAQVLVAAARPAKAGAGGDAEIDPRVEEYRLLIADVAELIGRSRATSDELARSVGQTVARWHLMSVLSPIDHDLAVVYEPLAPVSMLELLDERGIERLTCDEDEFWTQGANILAVAPRVVVLAAGNPKVQAKLEDAGVTVHVFDGSEVAVKGDGGPTCLTQPLWRA